MHVFVSSACLKYNVCTVIDVRLKEKSLPLLENKLTTHLALSLTNAQGADFLLSLRSDTGNPDDADTHEEKVAPSPFHTLGH